MTSEPLRETIRKRLRKRREDLSLTQEELCRRAGISLDAVSRIEGGSRTPTLETIEGLARALELRLVDLFQTEDSEMPTHSRPIQRTIALLEPESDTVQEAVENVVKALVKSFGTARRRAESNASEPADSE